MQTTSMADLSRGVPGFEEAKAQGLLSQFAMKNQLHKLDIQTSN